jgi:hypothetical protein
MTRILGLTFAALLAAAIVPQGSGPVEAAKKKKPTLSADGSFSWHTRGNASSKKKVKRARRAK